MEVLHSISIFWPVEKKENPEFKEDLDRDGLRQAIPANDPRRLQDKSRRLIHPE